jgi:glycosyltransferase involved in cell wall biosynthesis
MNRVCLYIGSYSPYTGGGFTYKTEIVTALAGLKQKEIEYFVAGENNEWKKIAENLGCKFEQVPKRETKKPSLFPFLKKDVKNKRQSFLIENRTSCVVNLSPLEWIHLDTPFIQVVWDLQHRRQPIFPEVSYDGEWSTREASYKSTLTRAGAVIVGNETGKQDVQAFYGVCPDNIHLIPLPTPSDALNTNNSPTKKANTPGEYIFYPAQLWPHKNHRVILEAQKILREEFQWELPLVLTGTNRGNLDALTNISKKYSVSHLFNYVGVVDRAEIFSLYKNAMALVFPSMFGPDNIPPLEAFALECPVLAADVPGAREQLKDGAGWFEPLNARILAEQLLRIKNDRLWKKNMLARGKELAALYKTENYAKELNMIIKKILLIRNRWEP